VILPALAGGEPIAGLGRPVSAKPGPGRFGYRDRPAGTFGLRLGDDELPVNPEHGLADGDRALGEVDIRPAQAEQFAAPKAKGQGADPQCFEAVAPDGLDEVLCVLDGEDRALGAALSWPVSCRFCPSVPRLRPRRNVPAA